jgi:hypothetical protein
MPQLLLASLSVLLPPSTLVLSVVLPSSFVPLSIEVSLSLLILMLTAGSLVSSVGLLEFL